MTDTVVMRNLVTHGYETQDHSPITVRNIRWYLYTGEIRHIANTRYAEIRKGLLEGRFKTS